MFGLEDLDLDGLTPLPDDSAPCPLAKLKSSEKFSQIMGYFRRIIEREEISERAFRITELAIEASNSFYQAWHYRRHLFFKLEKNLEEELEYLKNIGLENPKNYQVWSYRKELLRLTEDSQKELEYTDAVIESDERNVHAWGYRMWVVERFDLWNSQLEYVERYIEGNPRNNSAWNFRHFIISRLGISKTNSLGFVFRFAVDLLNESCFEYLKVLCDSECCGEIKTKLVKVVKEEGICVGLLKALQKCFEIEGKSEVGKWCFSKLMEIDEDRKEYWSYRMELMQCEKKELDVVDREFCEYFSISYNS